MGRGHEDNAPIHLFIYHAGGRKDFLFAVGHLINPYTVANLCLEVGRRGGSSMLGYGVV